MVTASDVMKLRERTGAGVMECKRALEEAGGNLEKATDLIKQAGLAKAEKKAGRVASQGKIETYVHAGGRIASMVEVNCETDFVARTEDFQKLAKDVAMQVAAMNPRFISEEEISEADWVELDREFGDRKKALEAVSLLDQAFIKDGRQNIRDLVKASIGKLGENVVIRRFARFELGSTVNTAEGNED